jgi:2,5-furandicarboxylate decarboxylase 1
MPSIDLRHFLGLLNRNGELLSVTEEVDPRYEICEFLHQADRAHGPALLFEQIKGHSVKVAGNLVGTKKRLALAFGLRSEEKLLETYRKRRGNVGKPRRVKDGPVKEVVLRNKQLDLNALPIPIYHEDDAGPYITCGILTARDPESGLRSMGLHRLQVKGARRLGIHLANPPISRFVAKAEENNRPLDVAISLGVHPILLLASIVSSPTEDKVAIAGSLLGSPLALTQCETSDVDVPAHAEVVIEGKVLPNLREPEGPFGETSGYYFSDQSHVIEVTAITHRKDPILQALHPTSQEVALLCGPAGEAEIVQTLAIRDLPWKISRSAPRAAEPMSPCRSRNGTIRMRSKFCIFCLPACRTSSVIVDSDVNVRDPGDIEWAIATRVQGDADLVVIPNLRARSIDPSKKEGMFTAKVGIDATVPIAERRRFKRISVPAEVKQSVTKRFATVMTPKTNVS